MRDVVDNARAGTTKLFLNNWKQYTTNPFVLECVTGCKINFEVIPYQSQEPRPIRMKIEEQLALENMIESFEKEGVITKTTRETGDFVNTVFLREKRDSCDIDKKYRMILNVKELNLSVQYKHFKMDTLESCLNMMERNCYMASIDLSNAYHSVPMDPCFSKYLKFQFKGQLYKYLVLPQGFKDSPRIFTKIMKPIVAHLHEKGHFASLYIDDFYLQGSTYEQCVDNVKYTQALVQSLGFSISSKVNNNSHPGVIPFGLYFQLKGHDSVLVPLEKKQNPETDTGLSDLPKVVDTASG